MRLPATIVLRFLKLMAPLFYLGKRGDLVSLSFGPATFLARRNSQDAVVLHEIWSFRCYDAVPILPGSVVVDIGAHIGGFAVRAAIRGARVFAYEAEQGNHELLKANLRRNHCQTAVSVHCAVASGDGKVTLNVDPTGSTLHSLYALTSPAQQRSVQSIGLHGLLRRHRLGTVDVLKIDAEGAEYEILLNARADDMRRIRTIILEYHDYIDHGHERAELERLLRQHGFGVADITPWYQHVLLESGMLLARREQRGA